MELDGVIHILLGSTLGLIIRMFIKYIPRRRRVFYLDHTLIVNVLASFFLGIFTPLNIANKNLLLFVFVGFLGCLSTFSSLIYQLFNFIEKRKYLDLFLYYIKILLLTFLFFCLGYFITVIFKI